MMRSRRVEKSASKADSDGFMMQRCGKVVSCEVAEDWSLRLVNLGGDDERDLGERLKTDLNRLWELRWRLGDNKVLISASKE